MSTWLYVVGYVDGCRHGFRKLRRIVVDITDDNGDISVNGARVNETRVRGHNHQFVFRLLLTIEFCSGQYLPTARIDAEFIAAPFQTVPEGANNR